MRDRGVQLDIFERNLHKHDDSRRGLGRLRDAIRNSTARKRPKFINEMLLIVSRGDYLTEKQLSAVNDWLERTGDRRVACPARLSGKENRLIALRTDEVRAANANVDKLRAERPLKPPGR